MKNAWKRTIACLDRISINKFIMAYVAIICLLSVLSICIGNDIVNKSISMWGQGTRVVFFIWMFSLGLVFVFNINYMMHKYGVGGKTEKILLTIGYFFAIMTGIHNWDGVIGSLIGFFLHTVSCLLFCFICYFALVMILFKINKKFPTKFNNIMLWIMYFLWIPLGIYILIRPYGVAEFVLIIVVLSIILMYNFIYNPRKELLETKEG